MKSITSTFFETKVQYDKILDNGKKKKVTETYVVDAMSFTEAETKTIEEVSPFISGEFTIVAEKIAPYREIFLSDKPDDSYWFLVKVAFITIDEKTCKEKKQVVKYLVQAKSVDTAHDYITDALNTSMVDYAIEAVSDTHILDVFLHNDNAE